MTKQTKHFIELSDIVALRFDCTHCGASLSLSLKSIDARKLRNCPNCNEPWAFADGQFSIEKKIEELAASLRWMEQFMQGGEGSRIPRKFNVLLETAALTEREQ
jgi:transcription elongation factor Elf1